MRRTPSLLLALVATGCAPAAAPPAPMTRPTVPSAPPPVAAAPVDPCAGLQNWPPPAACVERLAAGPRETCLVTQDKAFCWADEVRVISRAALEAEGLRLSGLRSAADGRSCAVQRGQVTCQGEHLTVGLNIEPDVPMQLPAGAVPTRVAVGPDHFCALTNDGAVHCQGDNDHGQLGDGTIASTYRGSRHAVGPPPIIDVVVGDRHSCALSAEGEVWCWGEVPSPPGFVPPLARKRWVDAHHTGHGSGASQLCLLSDEGEVACRSWVSHVFQARLEDVVELAAMDTDAYARSAAGQVWRWSSGTTPERVPLLEPASALGPATACVRLKGSDEIQCIRPEYDHRDETYRPGRAMQLAAGPHLSTIDTSCGLDARGVVHCWGNVGQDWFFDDTPPHRGPSLWMPHWAALDVISHVAKPVSGSRSIVELSARGQCARDRQGRLWMLAPRMRHHTLRLALQTAPNAVGAVKLLDSNACVAARADGSIFRLKRQFGGVTMGPPRLLSPVVEELPGAEGAIQIELGYNLHCLRQQGGATRCRQTSQGNAEGPFDVVLTDARSARIVVEGDEACAMLTEGGLHCRSVHDKTLSEVTAPMHHGSVRPLAVWPPR